MCHAASLAWLCRAMMSRRCAACCIGCARSPERRRATPAGAAPWLFRVSGAAARRGEAQQPEAEQREGGGIRHVDRLGEVHAHKEAGRRAGGTGSGDDVEKGPGAEEDLAAREGPVGPGKVGAVTTGIQSAGSKVKLVISAGPAPDTR
jgi:hypothetical protein